MEHVTGWLSAYIDGEMTPERRAQVEGHAAQCSSCRDALAEVRSVARLVADLPQKPLPAGFMQRLRRRQAQETQRLPFLMPRNGFALALASMAAVFVVYRGAKEKLNESIALVSGAASFKNEESAQTLDLVAAANRPIGAPKADKGLSAASRSAQAKKAPQAARAPGAPLDGESAAPEPPSRYSNEFLHKAVEAEQRQMGVVGIVPPNPRERAMKNFLRQQKMEGNDFVKLRGAVPSPTIADSAPAMLAAPEAGPAMAARRGAFSGMAAGGGGTGLSGGAGATGSATAYLSGAQYAPDGSGVILRSQADMLDLWRRLGLAQQIPTVDFSQQMLVMVLAGKGSLKLEIADASQTQGRLVVSYREAPESPAAEPFPFRAVNLTDLPVEFRKTP